MPDKATLDPMRAAIGVFPKKEHDWRVRQLTQAMAEAGIDEVLVYSWPWRPDNSRYLAGAPVTGTTLFRLRGDGHVSALVSNEVDRAAIRRTGWVSDIDRASQFSPAVLRGWLDGVGAGSRLGVTQLELMPVGLRRNIEQAQPNVKLKSATRLVDLVRFLKSAWEHERIRASVELDTRGWQAMFESMNPGVREFEVVAALEREIKRNGAADNFMLIASGTTEVRAMHAPEDRRLQLGDLVRTELTPRSTDTMHRSAGPPCWASPAASSRGRTRCSAKQWRRESTRCGQGRPRTRSPRRRTTYCAPTVWANIAPRSTRECADTALDCTSTRCQACRRAMRR